MNRKRSAGQGAEKIAGGIFLFAGIIMIIVTVAVYVSAEKFKKNAYKVNAVITDADAHNASGVVVKYNVEGREYEVRLNEYSSSMYEGKRITVYADKDYPGHVKTSTGSIMVCGILGIMGIVFGAVGSAIIGSAVRREAVRRRILQGGKVICAEVTGGIYCQNYRVNGCHPFKLDCKYEDTFSGKVYYFRSDYMWEDPEVYIGQEVKVYLNPDNMTEYIVDVDSLAVDGNIYDFR